MSVLCRSAVAAAILATTLLSAASAHGDDSLPSLDRKVDRLFAAYDKPDSPGCALGVVRDGNFVYKRGYGTASLELGVPIASESVFYMGSISKQFTAPSLPTLALFSVT